MAGEQARQNRVPRDAPMTDGEHQQAQQERPSRRAHRYPHAGEVHEGRRAKDQHQVGAEEESRGDDVGDDGGARQPWLATGRSALHEARGDGERDPTDGSIASGLSRAEPRSAAFSVCCTDQVSSPGSEVLDGERVDMRLRRLVEAALLAGLAALTLATCVFFAFDAIRIRVVREPMPANAGVVRVTTSDVRAGRFPPVVALIARIRNDSDASQRFSIEAGDQTICDAEVGARTARRLDCAVETAATAVSGPSIVIESASRTQWTLEYLELATHHGRSTGALHALIVPAGSTAYGRPHPATVLMAWIAITGALLLPRRRVASRAGRLLVHVTTAAVVALFAGVLSRPFCRPTAFCSRPGRLRAGCSFSWRPGSGPWCAGWPDDSPSGSRLSSWRRRNE